MRRAARGKALITLFATVIAGCAVPLRRGGQAQRTYDSHADTSSRNTDAGVAGTTTAVSVVDLSPKFLIFYDSAVASSLDPDARWALWKRRYGFAAVPPTPFGDSLARRLVDSAWPRYAAALPTIRRGGASFGFSADSILRTVTRLLGCGQHTRIRLIAFVGAFDENAFTFTQDGVASIAVPLEAGDARRSVVHEFTHAVHRSSGCADVKSGYGQSLAELVVSEGVAMRAVEQLLPGHPATYYIVATQGWLDSATARRPAILRGIGEHVAEAGNATAQRFTFGGGTTGLQREAYYAGWEIVGALLRSNMSLHDIAMTPADQLPALIRRGIGAGLDQP